MADESTPVNTRIVEELGPYSSRANFDAELAVLLADPEITLSDEDKHAVTKFGYGLLQGAWGGVTCTATNRQTSQRITYGEADKMLVGTNSHTFYLTHLQHQENKAFREALGIDGCKPESWAYVISQRVAGGEPYDLEAVRKVAEASTKWDSKRLQRALEAPREQDGGYTEPENFTVNFTPEALLQKVEAWQAYRQYYQEVKALLKQQADRPLLTAQRTLLDVHIGAVNAKMAFMYPPLIEFKRQIETAHDAPGASQWQSRLATVVPVFSSANQEEIYPQPVSKYARFLTRLDHIRNGVVTQADGTLGPIDPALLELAERVEQAARTDPSQAELAFSAEELACIKSEKWTSDQFAGFLEAVLASEDLRSSQRSTWDEVTGRSGRAPDGLWQVVRTSGVSNLAATSKTGTMKVPEQFGTDEDPTRPLDDLLKSASHELAHVFQGEENKKRAAELPLAAVAGRRRDLLLEMGGIARERQMNRYLGTERPVRLYFLRGLQAKLSGGNEVQVCRAIYDEMLRVNPSASPAKTRRTAVNSSKRLYGRGGHSTQALDYSIQELIVEAVAKHGPKAERSIALGASCLALLDAANLHRVDLFDLPDPDSIPSSADVVLNVFKQTVLPQIMRNQKSKTA
jgi:hypothetical protein